MTTDAKQRRRDFLRLASLAPLGFYGGWKSAHSMPEVLPEKGARIVEVKAYAVRRAIYAKVVADDGTAGWGECGHSGGILVAELVNRELADLVKGRDVFDADATWAQMFYEVDELGPGGLASQAIAGVDCALWDLRGKLLGLPVWKLLGGKYREKIPLYGSFSRDLGSGKYMTPKEAAEKAALLVAEGFKALKVRLAIREEGADPADDPAIPCVSAVRQAVGEKVEIYVDANNGYSASRAISIGKRLAEELGVVLFEEPVAAYQYASLARVAEALDIPIAAGEHEYTKWQFRDLILQGKPSVLNPDVSKLAGLTEALKVATLAEVFDLPISCHNARPTLLTAAHLHFVAATQMSRRTQEHPGSQRLKELWNYFENRLDVRDGFASVPDGPGLGLIPNESAIMKDAL